ncbi:hypothetical protein METBIDRAFT_36292, partial [Metschnikowia bicuspidata var. bicuspidata NRRL YB-4993]
MCPFEAENQALFVSKHYEQTTKDELLEHLVLELKIREAQIQIVLLLEIILCMAVDEADFLDTGRRQQAQAAASKRKPALIRRKKKKVIATFLGVGVTEPEGVSGTVMLSPKQDHMSPLSLYTSLVGLIDQIGLWDSLLEHGRTDKDENTQGFLAFVVVPFFGKGLPKTVLFIIKQIKGLRPNILRTRWTKSASSLEPPGLPQNQPSDPQSKFPKISMSTDSIPTLPRASTTTDADSIKPAFSLKRSKSNLGTRNLKRRQVDMSVAKNEPADTEPGKSNLFLFTDARRVKSGASLAQSSQSFTNVRQVEATPAKPAAPGASRNAPRVFATPQVLATPSNQRTVDGGYIVKETPQGRQEKKPSVHERLSQVARESPVKSMGIVSSPVR